MEDIMKNLENIILEQIKECNKNKTIPSSAILDIVKLIMTYYFSQSNF